MIKAVIFDIGAVLIQFDFMRYLCGMYDEKTAQTVYDAMWGTEAWHELDRGDFSQERVLEMFTGNAPAYAEQIRQAFFRVGECPRRQPYAIPWVDELKAKGYQVYFLSNYFPYLIEKCPQVLDFIPHMDGGVFSYQEKITKPAAEIYQRLMQRYGLQPEECVFIDDSQINIDAANALGLHAFRFESYEKQYPEVMGFLAEQTK